MPLPTGTNGVGFRAAVWERWLPALEAFRPQMLFMSGLALVEADYEWVTQRLMSVAQKWGEGRMVSVLEGGYDLSSLGRSVAAHIKVLSGL